MSESNMMYLNDFVELLEALPKHVRDKLKEVRECDSAVTELTNKTLPALNNYFQLCSKDKVPNEDEIEALLEPIKYAETLSLNKTETINNLYNTVQQYAQRLDQDLLKFKFELEADDAGCTEILEKKCLEYFDNKNKSRSLKRKASRDKTPKNAQKSAHFKLNVPQTPQIYDHKPEIQLKHSVSFQSTPVKSAITDNHKINVRAETHKKAPTTTTRKSTAPQYNSSTWQTDVSLRPNTSNEGEFDDSRSYCICNSAASGQMVACDNHACPIEWYHYDCVGLTEAPVGEWFCPQCRRSFLGK